MSNSSPARQLYIVMGVSGCGKSTIATELAAYWHAQMLDGDNFHSTEAKACMQKNKPLTDEQRLPWVERMCRYISQQADEQVIVLAFSGLKRAHRDLFRRLELDCHFIFLTGSHKLIAKRLDNRGDHFFSSALLESQFDALELPDDNEVDVTTFYIDRPKQQLVGSITGHFTGVFDE
ncbi:gluconokinase [Psychrobium sp. nBUS_13]|uniref:gluconokinase n=1 Tax=Psychrobium sp. nBUS_13 TaxID=3395319 RepID=UPI003EBB24CD